jgi:hypothetical protein
VVASGWFALWSHLAGRFLPLPAVAGTRTALHSRHANHPLCTRDAADRRSSGLPAGMGMAALAQPGYAAGRVCHEASMTSSAALRGHVWFCSRVPMALVRDLRPTLRRS